MASPRRRSRLHLPPLLRETAFRRYWSGATVSLFGDQVSQLAVPLAAVRVLHASAPQMGMLTAALLLPYLAFSVHLGALVDRRGNRRRLMIAADIGRAILLVSIPAAFAAGRLSMPLLYVVGFLMGTLTLLFSMANSTLFTCLVPEDRYVDANSLLHGSRAVAGFAGPGIAGLLVQAISAPFAVLADALSYVGSATALLRISPTEPPPAPQARGFAAAGMRFLWRGGPLRSAMLAVATINLFNFIFNALLVLYASRALRIGPAMLGLAFSAGAVGTIAGALAAARIGRRVGLGFTLLLGCILFPAPLLLVPIAGGGGIAPVLLLFLALVGSGFGVMLLDISFGSLFTALVSDAVRARVNGAFSLVNYGIRPIGALLGGLLPGLIGLHSTMWVATSGALLGFLWLLPSPILRIRTLGEGATERAAGAL